LKSWTSKQRERNDTTSEVAGKIEKQKALVEPLLLTRVKGKQKSPFSRGFCHKVRNFLLNFLGSALWAFYLLGVMFRDCHHD